MSKNALMACVWIVTLMAVIASLANTGKNECLFLFIIPFILTAGMLS